MPLPEEFQRIVLIGMNRKPYADQVLEHRTMIMDMEEQPQIPIDVTLDGFNHELAASLLEHVPDISLTKPLIIKRVMIKRADLEASNQGVVGSMLSNIPGIGKPKGPRPSMYAPHKSPLIPMIGLGGLYMGLGHLMNKGVINGERFGEYDKFLLKNPWLVPLFVGAITLGTSGLSDMLFHKKEAAALETLKKFPDWSKRLAIAVPTSYVAAGAIENKLQSGSQISKTEDLVRKHPFLTAMGGIGAYDVVKRGLKSYKTAEYLGSLDRVVYGLGPEKFDELYNDVVGITNP
jgi:hypothetical protein